MAHSRARVTTDRPARYGKQLAARLGRRVTSVWNEHTATGRVDFPAGTGTLAARPGVLVLEVEADSDHLAQLEQIMARHLVRFGGRGELVVKWQRDS